MRQSFPRRLGAAGFAVAVAIALMASGASGPSAAAAAATSADASKVDARIQEMVDAYAASTHTPGIAVALVRPDASGTGPAVSYITQGVPKLGSPVPVTPTTQFEIGSETKTYTGGLLAYLVSTGKVSLDDLVSTYAPPGIVVPYWKENGVTTQITLRDLATHQSGLPDTAGNLNAGCATDHPNCNQDEKSYTIDMLWQGVQATKLSSKPGTKWLYSNFAFGLLGTILAEVMYPGQNPPAYQQALNTAFLNPLGMKNTILERRTPQLATPYDNNGNPTWYLNDVNALAGAGGLISDITDMGTWVSETLGLHGDVNSPGVHSLATTLAPISRITTSCQDPNSCAPDDFQMGMAWQLYDATRSNVGVPWATKNGITPGYESTTYLAPSLRLGVTILTNRQDYDLDGLGTQILKVMVNAARTSHPSAAEVTVQPHVVKPGGSVEVSVQCGPRDSQTGATISEVAFGGPDAVKMSPQQEGFTVTVNVPASTMPGRYALPVSCADGSKGEATVTVAPAGTIHTGGDFTPRGAGMVTPLLGAAVLGLAGAAGIVMIRRRPATP